MAEKDLLERIEKKLRKGKKKAKRRCHKSKYFYQIR